MPNQEIPSLTDTKAGPSALTGSNPLLGISIVVAALMICLAILWPIYRKTRTSAAAGMCSANLRRSAAGLLMYAAENDGGLPSAASWMDQTSKYVPDGSQRCPAVGSDEHGYAFLEELNYALLGKVPNPEKQVALFESADLSKNAYGKTVQLPDPPRHDASFVALADGHVVKVKSGQKP